MSHKQNTSDHKIHMNHAGVETVQYIDGRKQIYKKKFYVLTHLQTSRPLFSYLSSDKSNVRLSQDLFLPEVKSVL